MSLKPGEIKNLPWLLLCCSALTSRASATGLSTVPPAGKAPWLMLAPGAGLLRFALVHLFVPQQVKCAGPSPCPVDVKSALASHPCTFHTTCMSFTAFLLHRLRCLGCNVCEVSQHLVPGRIGVDP